MTQNRLQESLKLFKQVMKGKHLQKSTVILFLNKLDLFKEKLEQGSEIKRHFPEYKGIVCIAIAAVCRERSCGPHGLFRQGLRDTQNKFRSSFSGYSVVKKLNCTLILQLQLTRKL